MNIQELLVQAEPNDNPQRQQFKGKGKKKKRNGRLNQQPKQAPQRHIADIEEPQLVPTEPNNDDFDLSQNQGALPEEVKVVDFSIDETTHKVEEQ